MLPRLCHVGNADDAAIRRAAELGFNGVVATLNNGAVRNGALDALAEACAARTMDLFLDFDFSQWDLHDQIVERHPDCFAIRRESDGEVVDPREPDRGHGRAFLRHCDDLEPVIEWGNAQLEGALGAGVKGVRAVHPVGASTQIWTHLIANAREHSNRELILVADTTGLARSDLPALADCGFDFTLSSLPWWDGRTNWLIEEHEALSRIAPVIAQVDAPVRIPPASLTARQARLALAALTGSGLMMPLRFADEAPDDGKATDLDAFIRSINSFVGAKKTAPRRLLKRSGAGANVTVLMSMESADPTLAEEAFVALVNPSPSVVAEPGPEVALALGDFNALQSVFERHSPSSRLPPRAARVFHATRSAPVRPASGPDRNSASTAADAPRIVIANVTPCVAGGRFPARRIVGERLTVEADIFTDGHPLLAAELSWRAEDERNWGRTRLAPLDNDRWRGTFDLPRIGRFRFVLSAWIDSYGGFVRDLMRKRDAGQDLELEAEEGLAHLKSVRARAGGAALTALDKLIAAFSELSSDDRVALLAAPETLEIVARADERHFLTRSQSCFVEVERQAARFASWYELFPRSQTESPARSGTFRDVIARLPAIAEMGFDVLYMTPIHPIGRTHRKGRNNALVAGAGDPGSTYAIGGPEGGHDAIHPELGSIEDFRALVLAAHGHGMEIALDFAVQCSRDHPWLAEHKGWFAWRPDGSIHFAENPPKKYEDIVNIDFYGAEAVPGAWLALRDIVLHWIDAGVRIFRVDNPHTKPFPFWEWMIADVRARHPNTIFLSEAFTRPKIMYRLAQLGFSQSYTYFTWRNTKRELTEYLTELTQPPVSDFFRPHFFVNTPDINPYFLQTSGRSGFLIRAALAATLSGLWGMYSGFELCEAEPLPGREEYMDSEKYEIKPRDWKAPGNIIAEITALNRLRREEPALQSHLGLAFYNAFNDNLLYYGKSAPGHRDRILVAVNLDPHNAQEADFEIPLWEWGLSDDQSLECEDLLDGRRWVWQGKIQHMRLTPDAPYAIWRVRPAREI
ncbi:MAG TPA: alpha-1,4-glucan--maltose-1-phosphate maltosyltransferase [Rhizomicrobium sp.]|nr:alpha-1,4-glucan--maltose-1-phosphate maltosyltransferase [Rhizomicrobium sp.]